MVCRCNSAHSRLQIFCGQAPCETWIPALSLMESIGYLAMSGYGFVLAGKYMLYKLFREK